MTDHKPPVKVESRDERLTMRLTPTERREYEAAALATGEELSRYVRACARIGHTVRQAGNALKVTVG